MRAWIAVICMVLSTCGAYADDNECVAIAHEIGTNSATSLSHDQQKAVYLAGLCVHDWQSATSDQRVQIKASYELFTGDGSASDQSVEQSQHDECQNQFGSQWQDKLQTNEERTVSADGAAVVSTCLELKNDSLLPNVMVVNGGKEVSLSLQYKPNTPGTIQLTAFGPVDLHVNKCSVTKNGRLVPITNPADVAQTLKPVQGVTITCEREQNKTEIDNVSYECTDETIFNISTSGPSRMIKIPRVCSETIKPSVAGQLAADVKKVEADEQQLTADIAGLKSQVGALPAQIDANKTQIFNSVIPITALQPFGACNFLGGNFSPGLAGTAWPSCNDAAVNFCTSHFGVSSAGTVTGADVSTGNVRVVCVKGS